jgi:multiple sugar transport system permease protein
VLPVILLYFIISIIPVGFAIVASFHAIPLLSPEWTFIGFENYLEVLRMEEFWASLWRGVIYMIGSTVFQLVIGLWMALVLNRLMAGQRLLTAVVFTAYLIPTIIVAFWALFMFDTGYGVLHAVFGGWLWGQSSFVFGTPDWAMPIVILVGSWKFSVFITIFVLAQLRSIPQRQYEAAKIVGANRWQMFRDVTLPRLKGIILVVVLLRSIFMFNKFDIIWQLTRGGPGDQTTTLPILAYRVTFNQSAYGVGSALAVVMFVFLALGGIAYFAVFNPSEEVEI